MLNKKVLCTLMITTLLTVSSCTAQGGNSSSNNPSTDSPSTSIIPSDSSTSELPSTDPSTSEQSSTDSPTSEPSTSEDISSSESTSTPESSDLPTSTPEPSVPETSIPETSEPESSLPETSIPESSVTPSTPSEHVHNFGDWVYDKQATEFEEGLRHRTCECGETITEVVPYALDFPRVHIDYKDFHPDAPDAKNYNGFANWCWNYLDVPIRFEGFHGDDHSRDFDCVAKMRIQGATSKDSSYLKKNYTIKLYQDRACTVKNNVAMVDSWGAQNKYVLKANWIDYTSARNLVGADMWSDVVSSRTTSNIVTPRLYTEKMIHNGAVDGFPVMLYFNDEYYGLYTFNIPKDNWLFGMKRNPNEALLFADGTTKKPNGQLYQSTGFKELIQWDNNKQEGSGWEAEYAYDELNTKWMADSMNQAIQLVMDTYGKLRPNMSQAEKRALRDKFIMEAPNHLDIDGCIDYMIFLHCLQAFPDNSTKNVIWSTYDGKIWSPNAYDLDTILGMAWNGDMYVFEDKPINETTGGFWGDSWYRANLRGNALFEAILLFYAQKAQNRFNELTAPGAPLNYDTVASKFTRFINDIPSVLYKSEKEDYPTRPSEKTNKVTGQKNTTDLNQILTYSKKVLDFMTNEYNGPKMTTNINYFN